MGNRRPHQLSSLCMRAQKKPGWGGEHPSLQLLSPHPGYPVPLLLPTRGHTLGEPSRKTWLNVNFQIKLRPD